MISQKSILLWATMVLGANCLSAADEKINSFLPQPISEREIKSSVGKRIVLKLLRDGTLLFVGFSTAFTVACCNLDGNERWRDVLKCLLLGYSAYY